MGVLIGNEDLTCCLIFVDMYSLVQLSKKFPIDEDGEIPLPAETPEGYTTLGQTMVNNFVLNIREWTWCIFTVNPRFDKPTGIPYRNILYKTKLLIECFSVTLDTTFNLCSFEVSIDKLKCCQ